MGKDKYKLRSTDSLVCVIPLVFLLTVTFSDIYFSVRKYKILFWSEMFNFLCLILEILALFK